VHHRTYERLGRELAGDLVVLCSACHRRHHRDTGRPRRSPQTAAPSTPPPAPRHGDSTEPVSRSLLRRLLSR